VPAIKDALGLTDAQLGLALFGMAAGTLAGGRLGGLIAARFGAWRTVRLGLPVFGVLLIGAALAGNLLVLAGLLFGFGVVAAVVDVSMNAEAVTVERSAGRPLLSGFHGLWSLGLMAGALAGVGSAATGLGPAVEFALVTATAVGLSAPLLARLPHRRELNLPPGTAGTDWSAAVAVLGLIAFCSFFAEGAAADWSAVFLRDTAGAGAAVAAAGFACFSLGMFAARMASDRLAQAVGPVRLVLTSSVAAACGLGLALGLANPAAGVIGFGLLGLGLGPVVPTVVSAAAGAGLGTLESVVSQVFTIGYVGGVSGPAAIGAASGQVGLRAALVIPLCLVLCITATSRRLATAAGADLSQA
jgi:predicted MFS family arabinose efflux permease